MLQPFNLNLISKDSKILRQLCFLLYALAEYYLLNAGWTWLTGPIVLIITLIVLFFIFHSKYESDWTNLQLQGNTWVVCFNNGPQKKFECAELRVDFGFFMRVEFRNRQEKTWRIRTWKFHKNQTQNWTLFLFRDQITDEQERLFRLALCSQKTPERVKPVLL